MLLIVRKWSLFDYCFKWKNYYCADNGSKTLIYTSSWTIILESDWWLLLSFRLLFLNVFFYKVFIYSANIYHASIRCPGSILSEGFIYVRKTHKISAKCTKLKKVIVPVMQNKYLIRVFFFTFWSFKTKSKWWQSWLLKF